MDAMTETSNSDRYSAFIGGVQALVLFIFAQPCLAQDIEPRRWSHLPLGSNFGGVAYAYTEGDIFSLQW
jgi:hypothetical protein